MKSRIYIILLSVFLSACISDYNPSGIDELSNLLVVEGTITDGTTVIRLSKSVGLTEDINTAATVHDAQVSVECSDGTIYHAIEYLGDGKYSIKTGTLNTDLQYRLRIKLDGLEYESEYLNPLKTLPIDKIYWKKENNGSEIAIFLSTLINKDQTLYYKWSYDESWEIKSRLYASATIIGGKLVEYNLATGPFNEGYYCWISKKSNSLLLASSDKLSENAVINKKLIETIPTDSRFSELYYIKVYQNSIRKEAYDYYSNLQKNIEETGSIFGPIPSEMEGNVRCLNKPSVPVIGYIEVSLTTNKAIYIPTSEDIYEWPYMNCSVYPEGDDRIDGNFMIHSFEERLGKPPLVFYGPARCIDCRLNGGTKNKPDFWPNDHK